MASPDEETAKERVKRFRQLIAGESDERNNAIKKRDRNALIKFDDTIVSDREESQRCGWKHHANLLQHLYQLAVKTDSLAQSLEAGEYGVEAKEALVSCVQDNYDGGYTIQAKLSAIRVFAKTVLPGSTLPERFATIEPSAHVDKDPAPPRSKVIEYSEVVKMVGEMDLLRDKALLPAQHEAGTRPMSEMYPLQMGDLKVNEDHIIIDLERTSGKTDRRQLLLTYGMPWLKKWLRNHPVWDDPDSPLDTDTDKHSIESIPDDTYIWTHHNRNEHLSYEGFATRFREAGKRAGIVNKECSGQHFRRSSASIAARKPEIGERDLREYYDWSRYSDSPEHYISSHSEKVLINFGLARGHEVANAEDHADTSPVPCKRCQNWTLRGINNCVHCNYDISDEQANLDDLGREMSNPYASDISLHEKVLNGDVTADDLESVQKVQSDIEGMGEKFFRQLEDLKQRAKALEGMNIYSGVEGVVAVGLGHAVEAGNRSVEAWVRLKQKAMRIHPDYTLPTNMKRSRQMKVYSLWMVSLIFLLLLTYIDGTLANLAAGDPSEWAAVLIAISANKIVADRTFPTVEEARAAAQTN